MTKNSYKPFIWLFIGIILMVVGVVLYNQYIVDPNKRIEELSQNATELEKKNKELQDIIDQNLTQVIEKEPIVNKQSGWAIVFLLTTIGLVVYVLILMKKGTGAEKLRHEIIAHARKYSIDKDGIRLWRCVKYLEGFYKADHVFPVSLVVFTTRAWTSHQEPFSYITRGFLMDRRNPDNVLEDFSGMTIREIVESIKETTWGMRGPHYKPYKTKSYEEEALKQFYAKEEAVTEAVEFKKAIEDRA